MCTCVLTSICMKVRKGDNEIHKHCMKNNVTDVNIYNSYYEISWFTYDLIKTREMKRKMNQRYFQCKKEI